MIPEAEPDTLRSDLEAAFDAPETAVTTEAGPETAATGSEQPEPVAAASDDRPRGPDGKFLPKEAESAPKAAKPLEKPVQQEQKSPSTDATKASEQVSTPANAPPVGWTADAKAEWASLSPAIKAAVLKREVEISSGGKQWSEEKRRYEEIVAPVRQAASRRGISEAEGIQRLMAAQDRLDRNPAEAIQWLANAYRVPITVQSDGSPAEITPQVQFAPMLAPLHEQLNAIQQRFAMEDQRQTDMTVQRVNQFAQDPTHPHFDAVSDEIMAMLPLLKTSNPHATPEQLLQDAYDRAVWANPGTRAAIEAERVAQADAKQRADRSAAVNKAKLASSSLRGTPTGSPSIEPPDTIRGAILAAMEAR